MTINCAIIDDEPLAAGLLESYVAKTPYLNLTGTYNFGVIAAKDPRDHIVRPRGAVIKNEVIEILPILRLIVFHQRIP